MNITVLSQCRILTLRDRGGGGWSSRLLNKGGGAVFLKKLFRPEVWSPESATVSQGLLSRIIDVKNNQYTY